MPRIIVGLTIEAVGEALLFAAKAGADPAKVREALMGGFAYHNAAPNVDRKKDAIHGVDASDQINAAAALRYCIATYWDAVVTLKYTY